MTIGTTMLKPGVQIDGLQPAGIRILSTIDQVAKMSGLNLVITCGTEDHPPDDPHTRGVALDIRSDGLPVVVIEQIHESLIDGLGPMFTVLYECPTAPQDMRLAAIAYINASASAPHFHVQLKRPTPMDAPLHLRARIAESSDDRAVVEATLEANGKITATCRGTFVAVKEGHPAYRRW